MPVSSVSKARGQQPATSGGVGISFESPKKKRPKNPKVRSTWSTFDPTGEAARLQEEYRRLRNVVYGTGSKENTVSGTANLATNSDVEMTELDIDTSERPTENRPCNSQAETAPPNQQMKNLLPTAEIPEEKRIVPNDADQRRHQRWLTLLPMLIDDVLAYQKSCFSQLTTVIPSEVKYTCTKLNSTSPQKPLGCKGFKSAKILCLYFDHFKYVTIDTCSCRSIQQLLVSHGLFPTAPSQTRMAVSVDMLNFYGMLFERSCDAINALAHALNSFYLQRGFYLLNKKGDKFLEPFRKGLGYAARWFQVLKLEIEDKKRAALEEADKAAQVALWQKEQEVKHSMSKSKSSQGPDSSRPQAAESSQSSQETNAEPQPNPEVARKLAELCPACFGLKKFGRSLESSEGGDFHLATDGNFHHRHALKAGSGISFRQPFHIIPSDFVNTVGEEIDRARKQKPRSVVKPKVPSSAVDECEKSYEAANGDKKKATDGNERFDSYGLMSLVCRHDIPLFFANIDTPGEQQRYSIALVRWIFNLLPSNATVTLLYDIGCVLDRSIELYDILPANIASRIRITTTAMHAYGHQWSCQLVYNPRMCDGLGLTDGEGVERNWSKMYKIIGIERVSASAGRDLILDLLITSIATRTREELGAWMKRRLKNGVEKQQKEATERLTASGKTEGYLRKQWCAQKKAQLSSDSHSPAALRDEINCILTLQDEIESLESVLGTTKATLMKAGRKQTKRVLESLETQHETLVEEVEELYASLKIHHAYPQLKGLEADFTRTLLLAHDLKIDIRQRAVQSFFEWEKLDQAVGGRGQALGTKLHQHTRQSISKRAPALVRSIRKFNGYCEKLQQLKPKKSKIPLPNPLPTTLEDLRSDSTLHQDVWMTPSSKDETLPPWLDDTNTREGIRAMLRIDRCKEERSRLELESNNMCRWFGRELLASEIALRCSRSYTNIDMSMLIPLTQHRDHILHLKSQWTSEFASPDQYSRHVEQSVQLADQLFGKAMGQSLPLGHFIVTELEDPVPNRDAAAGDTQEVIPDADPVDSPPTEEDVRTADALVLRDLLEEHSRGLVGQVNQVVDVKLQREVAEDSLLDISLVQQLSLDNASKRHPLASGSSWDNPRRSGRAVFERRELEILRDGEALLNDGCLNGCAHLLLETATSQQPSALSYALFSTFDLVNIRSEVNDLRLWRNIKHTRYWEKDTWILPIHRPKDIHWVLCVAYTRDRKMLLFDSLGFDESGWADDLEVISRFLARLSVVAGKFTDQSVDITHSVGPWTAWPAITKRVQFTNHNCGLWVLLWIAATLRGFQSTGGDLMESTVMPSWRRYLLNLVYSKTVPL